MHGGSICFATLVTIAATALPSAATADEPGSDGVVANATGGGFIPGQTPHYTVREKTDARVKGHLWASYADLVDGRISQEAFDRIERRAWRLLPSDDSARRITGTASGCPPQDPTCPRPKQLMSIPHRGQINGDFCGPATGVMIAAYSGKRRSATNHSRLSQPHMASWKHMKTRRYDVTRYASKNWTRGMNKWLKGRKRGPYTQKDNPSAKKFRGALLYNTRRTKPMGVSTVEYRGERSYNGHNTAIQTVGHWLVSRGYAKTGRRSYLLDPATTVWSRTDKRFRIRTKRFVKKYVDNGISA